MCFTLRFIVGYGCCHFLERSILMCAANKHLTLHERIQIENGLNNNLSFKAIAAFIDKDCTTVSKEIRLNLTTSSFTGHGRTFNPCIHRFSCDKHFLCSTCKYKRPRLCRMCKCCSSVCKDFVEDHCPMLDKPPYVCNACPMLHTCTLRKHLYDPYNAFQRYIEKKSESRKGVIISQDDIDHLNQLLVPLIRDKKQSIHHVFIHHKDEIMFSEKTLYKIIDLGLLKVRNIDLPLKVRRKVRVSNSTYKIDKKCRDGRTFDDFHLFMNDNPDTPVVQMDSVIGRKGGKVLLTLHFTSSAFMLAFLRDYNDSASVIHIFNDLYERLGYNTFHKLFPLILTDNGSEFSNPSAIEFDEYGNRRTRIFYCDPSAPYQKGACEVNHEFIRRIAPKGKSFDAWSQHTVDKMMSHINSYNRNALYDKSPIDLFTSMFDKETLDLLNIKKIAPDLIDLSEKLIKDSGCEHE